MGHANKAPSAMTSSSLRVLLSFIGGFCSTREAGGKFGVDSLFCVRICEVLLSKGLVRVGRRVRKYRFGRVVFVFEIDVGLCDWIVRLCSFVTVLMMGIYFSDLLYRIFSVLWYFDKS